MTTLFGLFGAGLLTPPIDRPQVSGGMQGRPSIGAGGSVRRPATTPGQEIGLVSRLATNQTKRI